MVSYRTLFIRTAVLLFLTNGFFSSMELFGQEGNLKVGDIFPEFDVESIEGLPISFRPPDGRLLLVIIWDTNSPRAEDAARDTIVLYKRFHDSGFDVVGICTNLSEGGVEEFSTLWTIPWPQAMNEDIEGADTTEQLGILELPITYLLDSDGRILAISPKGDRAHAAIAGYLGVSLDDLPKPAMPTKRTKPSFEPSGTAQAPGEGAYSLLGSLEERERIEPCRSNLRQIGIALTSYQLDHKGEWPDWLSDLYPKYLQDESILLCPNHPSATVYRGLIDPKMKCSYVYEFAPIEWDGAIYRDIQKAKLEIYGDKVPVVRCLKCLEDGRALNLSYGGEIYLSGEIWEDDMPTDNDLEDAASEIRQQFRQIAAVIHRYKKEHGKIPDELDMLHPDYIPDVKTLSNPVTGWIYSYEFSPNIPNPYTEDGGTLFDYRTKQMEEFGGYVPIIRAAGILNKQNVINLSYHGEVWQSTLNWERDLRSSMGPMVWLPGDPPGKQIDPDHQLENWRGNVARGTITIQEDEQIRSICGSWQMDKEMIQQTDIHAKPAALIFEPVIEKGEIRLRARVMEGKNGFRIVFGYKPAEEHYAWTIGGQENKVNTLDKRSTLREIKFYNVLNDPEPYNVQQKIWNTIRLLVDADKRTVIGYLNGEKRLSITLEEETLKGRFGLAVNETIAEFDQISIIGR